MRPQSSRVRYDDAEYSSTYYGRGSARVRVSSEHPARTQSASRPARTQTTRTQTTRTQAARPQGSRKKKGGGSRYVASIDGLRAFAVLAVIFYHMKLGWAPGGLMGVTVFFVISGYLITGLLVNERVTTGTIDLPAFWMRRVRRLFPAIVLSVTGICALCTLFGPELLDKMKPDIVPSLFFFNNWWQIFHEISYFDAVGHPSPLQHFWSLSIEEQFYLVWPLLLLLMFALRTRRRTMRRIITGLAIVSAVLMAVLYDPFGDPSRVYYGTDTRAMSLLVGAWLAITWPSAAFGGARRMKTDAQRLGIEAAGILGLAGLIVIVVCTNGFSAFPYYGGIALTSVLSALLIAALVIPGTLVDAIFELKPLVWIGKRSYGMYLWHFPILLLTTNVNSTVAPPIWLYFVQIALIFLVSHLSYEFIENPVRKGAIGDWMRARREGRGEPISLSARISIGVVAVLLAVSAFGILAGPVQAPASSQQAQSSSQEQASDGSGGQVPPGDSSSTASESGSESGSSSTSSQSSESASSSASTSSSSKVNTAAADARFAEQRSNANGDQIYEPLLICDSVAETASDQFYAAFPNGKLDFEIGRNFWNAPYSDYADADQVGEYVIICLGSNGNVEQWHVDDLMSKIDDSKRVFFVNTRCPEVFEEATNQVLADAVDRYDNVVGLVDWYGASEGHDEYFDGDGEHLTPTGADVYMGLIEDAVKGYEAEHPSN